MQTTFGVKEIKELIVQLESENNPDNDTLIKFYKKKISEAMAEAILKVYKEAFEKLKNN